MDTLEMRARDFANLAHARVQQVREYTFTPYIEHPEAVVEIVRSVPHTAEMLAAAWLHDTVEDTGATLEDIERLFGFEVASLVEQLTDVSRPGDGNRTARKAIDRAHTARATPQAKTIKLADLIDNSRSILEHDQAFARVYLREKAALLDALTDGDPTLLAKAKAIVEDSLARMAA